MNAVCLCDSIRHDIMPRIIIRAAAFLLIPALIADPTLAAGLNPLPASYPQGIQVYSPNALFQEEALSGSSGNFILSILRQFGVQLRRQEKLEARSILSTDTSGMVIAAVPWTHPVSTPIA